MIRTAFAALFAAALAIVPASARDVTADEKAALEKAVADFDAAFQADNYEVVIGTVPPKVFEAIASSAGLPVDTLREIVVTQSKAAMEAVTVHSFSMDLATAEYLELPDGTPYVLIPTETTMDAGTGKVQAKSDTLGLLDEGKWYLLRVSETEQVAILRQVYPQFADVTFDPGTMESVE